VPTSEVTAKQARGLNIPLSDLDTLSHLDVVVDGADEIDGALNLIKGAGGALLREKIVADAATRMIVIADATKMVATLGAFALPVEVNKFGLGVTQDRIERILQEQSSEGSLSLRMTSNGVPYETDGGHLIFDACFGRISDAKALSNTLLDVPGVVQHGLFLDMCDIVYGAKWDGIVKYER
jgi:ribose 5-phosphate isomerase A